MKKEVVVLLGLIFIFSCNPDKDEHIGMTQVTKWKDDKKTAISITYDDGTINQFTVAKPIMDKFQMPGTFYIITGKIDGAQKGKFIGRPKEEIIEETKLTMTNKSNFFERASLIAFTGTTEGPDYHSRVGSLFESGKTVEAYQLLDEGYEKIRTGKIKTLANEIFHHNSVDTTT
jgi:hypothetical protein